MNPTLAQIQKAQYREILRAIRDLVTTRTLVKNALDGLRALHSLGAPDKAVNVFQDIRFQAEFSELRLLEKLHDINYEINSLLNE